MALPEQQAIALLLREVRLVETVEREDEAADETRGASRTLGEELLELRLIVRDEVEELIAGGVLKEEPSLDGPEPTLTA